MKVINIKPLSNNNLFELMRSIALELENREYYKGIAAVSGNPFTGIEQRPFKPKSANQQRYETIQRAREFVEVKLESLKNSPDIEGGWAFKIKENPKFCHLVTEIEFIVNPEKRTVVALLKLYNQEKVEGKGIAKCMPGDVFNEWIGKAIALARALRISIPDEFMYAVQPDDIVVGMKVVTKLDYPEAYEGPIYKGEVFKVASETELTQTKRKCHKLSNIARNCSITDDTNAEYGPFP